jgi:hypothetical protein
VKKNEYKGRRRKNKKKKKPAPVLSKLEQSALYRAMYIQLFWVEDCSKKSRKAEAELIQLAGNRLFLTSGRSNQLPGVLRNTAKDGIETVSIVAYLASPGTIGRQDQPLRARLLFAAIYHAQLSSSTTSILGDPLEFNFIPAECEERTKSRSRVRCQCTQFAN